MKMERTSNHSTGTVFRIKTAVARVPNIKDIYLQDLETEKKSERLIANCTNCNSLYERSPDKKQVPQSRPPPCSLSRLPQSISRTLVFLFRRRKPAAIHSFLSGSPPPFIFGRGLGFTFFDFASLFPFISRLPRTRECLARNASRRRSHYLNLDSDYPNLPLLRPF